MSKFQLEPRVLEVLDAALDRAAEWAADNARDEAETVFGVCATHGVESPIEQLFLAALLPYLVMDPSYKLDYQVPIGDYRADFVVSFTYHKRYPPIRVVVECDGHQFHEKTKEQAERDKKRDRYMTAAGYTVMRFTGRELWRDPDKCVQEVIDFTQDEMERFHRSNRGDA